MFIFNINFMLIKLPKYSVRDAKFRRSYAKKKLLFLFMLKAFIALSKINSSIRQIYEDAFSSSAVIPLRNILIVTARFIYKDIKTPKGAEL